MSDVSVAPQSAPAAAPSVSSEVPINPNSVNTPTPIGQQAPQKPEGVPNSRREAIQAAFDRANNPNQQNRQQAAPKPAPKAAEAKPGHNMPPEKTADEPLNLKKRPGEQAAPASAQNQPRVQGKFAPRETNKAAAAQNANAQTPNARSQNAQTPSPAQQPARKYPDLPATAPFRDPPVRASEAAKADWAGTPETVRGDIHRLQKEFGQAYNYYKASHEAMQPIKHYHQMAIDHGTTLAKALDNYTGMEAKLRADPIAGLDLIVNNLNLKSADGQRLGLRDIAYHVLSQSPEQLRATQQQNNLGAAAHQISALHQELAGLKGEVKELYTEKQFTKTRSAIDQFADTHPRFDELGTLIEQELKLGFDLETAYRRAELLRPSTQGAQTPTTPAQTRPPVDKSISGSPAGPVDTARKKDASRNPREAVQNAINRMRSVG